MFRFTLRELLLLTLVVGLAVGWAVDHRSLATSRDEAYGDAEFLAKLGKPDPPGFCGTPAVSWLMTAEKYTDKFTPKMTDEERKLLEYHP